MIDLSRGLFDRTRFVVSFSIFVVFAGFVCGLKFGLGITGLLLFHEMGHYIEIRRRNFTAELPVFLPGLGAFVRWSAKDLRPVPRAAISLAGPLIGSVLAGVFAISWSATSSPLFGQLAREGIRLNALNLIPLWILDGRQAMIALSTTQRFVVLVVALCFWYVLGEQLFLYIAVGTAWRVIADRPNQGSVGATAWTLGIYSLLAVLMNIVPDAIYYEFPVRSHTLMLLLLLLAWLLIAAMNFAMMRSNNKEADKPGTDGEPVGEKLYVGRGEGRKSI